MLNEAAKKWVAALRSGEYKQGKNRLHRNDEFCCLGVLCDLAVKENIIPPPISGFDAMRYGEEGDCSVNYLPKAVAGWAKLRTSEGRPTVGSPLSKDNDCGKTFQEIADIIESEPHGLFVNSKHAFMEEE